jgi:hypothetical protein
MQREVGDKSFPIWLLGDSEPDNWKLILDTPFDPRHPIRHNIWTSVLDLIQQKLYLQSRIRLDSDKIFIRNAVDDPSYKPKGTEKDWSSKINLQREIENYKALVNKYNPKLILSFGAFSFEFARRSLNETPERAYNYWGSYNLGTEFRGRISTDNNPLLLPLMHRVIAGGRFPNAHRYYMGLGPKDPIPNYFQDVAGELADIIIQYDRVFL